MVEVSSPVTFGILSNRHLELLTSQAEDRLDPDAIAGFIEEAATAGVQIESISERDGLRAMINYWTATLARMPSADPPPGQEGPETAGEKGFAVGDDATDLPGREAPSTRRTVVQPTLAKFDASLSPTLDEAANPFVGLAAFDTAQSSHFFGRDAVVRDLARAVRDCPLVVVSGASGTGKSSLVRAGLIPAIKADPATADWLSLIATPGRDPISNLIAAAAPQAGREAWVQTARAALDADAAAFAELVAARGGGATVLLVIDQAEELFSLSPPEECGRAAQAIAAVSRLPRAHVVVTIRDEYLENERVSRALPDLDLAAGREFSIPPLDASDIRDAIVLPAQQAGLVFQDGVVDRIVADVGSDPAALPLLQYALLRLWQRREGNRITLDVYKEVGGPSTVLSNVAQHIYHRLGSPQARENCRVVFQQLIRPSLMYEFVRDRVTRGEMERLLPPGSIATVVKPFADAALLRVTPGSDRGEDRIEIAHEALIRNWDMLRRWALEVHDRERAFLSLDAQAERWIASHRTIGHLLLGRALSEAETILENYRKRARVDPLADARVSSFLAASRVSQRRIWSAIVATVLVLLGLIAAFGLAYWGYTSRLEKKQKAIEGLTQSADTLSDRNSSLAALADMSSADDDTARQFIQMLLTRGTINQSELPLAFAGMTPRALVATPAEFPPQFDEDFLHLGQSIVPAPPSAGSARLDLTHMRLFFDSAHHIPVLTISETDRSQPQLSARINGLFRWPDLSGQPDERRLAAQGVMLARLVPQRELAWGPQMAAGARAANLLPAMIPLGGSDSAFAHLGAWSALGAWLRVNHDPQASRVVYLSGAVPADGPSDGTAPPKAMWKIAVSVDASGRVIADAALLPGAMSPDGLPGRTSVAAIARASGLDFSALERVLQNAGPATPQVAAPAQLVARVYIETRNVDSGTTQSIRDALSAQGFITPRIEQVDPCIAPAQLRYYYPQDLPAAQLAARTATETVLAARLGSSVQIIHLDPVRYKAKQGNLELWLCGD